MISDQNGQNQHNDPVKELDDKHPSNVKDINKLISKSGIYELFKKTICFRNIMNYFFALSRASKFKLRIDLVFVKQDFLVKSRPGYRLLVYDVFNSID